MKIDRSVLIKIPVIRLKHFPSGAASLELVNPGLLFLSASDFRLSPPRNSESSQEKGFGPRTGLSLKPSPSCPLDPPGVQAKNLAKAEFSTEFPSFHSEGAALERFIERFGRIQVETISQEIFLVDVGPV